MRARRPSPGTEPRVPVSSSSRPQPRRSGGRGAGLPARADSGVPAGRPRPQQSLALQTNRVENLHRGTLGQIDETVVSSIRLLQDVDEPRCQALRELAMRKEFVTWVRGALGGAAHHGGCGAECPRGAEQAARGTVRGSGPHGSRSGVQTASLL